jgi:hypothetical protein
MQRNALAYYGKNILHSEAGINITFYDNLMEYSLEGLGGALPGHML